MKFFLPVLVVFLSITVGYAQVQDAEVEFNKTKRIVKSIDIPDESEIVEEAVKSKFSKLGLKPKNNKGWQHYQGVNLPAISPEVCDVYVKVDKKSKKEKDNSTVYYFVTKPGDHANAAVLANEMLSADGFNNEIKELTKVGRLEKDIVTQEDMFKKASKKQDDLVKDQGNIEKRIKKAQEELEDNKKKQEMGVQELEQLKKQLEQLKERRS